LPREIGIDFGQTNCRTAWLSGAGGPQILLNSDNERATPAVVALQPGGQWVAGTGALALLSNSPERVVRGFGARLAAGQPVAIDGKAYRPESLAAFLLRRLKSDAEARLNDQVTRAVVAVPASWDQTARQRFLDAGAEAGLPISLVESSMAAALAAGFRQRGAQQSRILIYDLGGMDLSLSVVAADGASLALIKTATLAGVGGTAFDQFIVDYATVLIEQQYQVKVADHARFLAELYKQAEQAKIMLGAHRSTDIRIGGMLRTSTGAVLDVDVEVEREEFERMLEDTLRSTLLSTLDILGAAGHSIDQIDAVVLSGRSTGIPCVRRAVQNFVGLRKVVENLDSGDCVALGAAWMTSPLEIQVKEPEASAFVTLGPGAVPAPAAEPPKPEPSPAPQPEPPPQAEPAPQPKPEPAQETKPEPAAAQKQPAPEPAAEAPGEQKPPVEAPAPAETKPKEPQAAPAPKTAPAPAPAPAPPAAPAGPVSRKPVVMRLILGVAGAAVVLYLAYFIWQLRPPEYTRLPLHPSETVLQKELRDFRAELPDLICTRVRELSEDGVFSAADRANIVNHALADRAALATFFKNSGSRLTVDLKSEEVLGMIQKCLTKSK